MTWRMYALLFLLGLGVALGVAHFQSAPGYMDADYYYAGGLRLADGHGFSEPFLWNYLDDPDGLPHPSHAYWMPLASILAGAGMRLAGTLGFAAARWPFLLLSASVPLITAALTFSLTSRRDLSLCAGLLAAFAGYYAPFLSTTDTFGLYMLLGGAFFLALGMRHLWLRALALGVLTGLMHLARADGVMWLVIGALGVLFVPRSSERTSRSPFSTFCSLFLLLAGYALVMAPWLMRNLSAFGAPLAPGGGQMLWLTRYDEIFSYPANRLSFETWLASGWGAILQARLWALKWNLGTMLGVQGGIVLFPLILVGVWRLRADMRVRLGALAWGLTFFVMTVIFPFAGARGSFYHSGAALQPLWWALAPVGLDRIVAWGARRRNWPQRQARRIFQTGLVGIAILLTGAIVFGRVIAPSSGNQAWGWEANRYRSVEAFISERGAPADAVVIVGNPPGYFAATGRAAISVPDGDVQTLLAVAERYNGRYLLLEPNATPGGLLTLLEKPEQQSDLTYLGLVDGARVFVIQNP
ncbi:MAG: hypothetical protein GXP40_08605 [Chloroflexi bacterium]|nr:hypothetical protein [Chloroflexota bacterium]